MYKFNKGVLNIIDRKRPRKKKFKWWHGFRFGRPVAKIHLQKNNLWYNQKKNCLLNHLVLIKIKETNNILFKNKTKLNIIYITEE